jgi:hypothetical protein
MKTKIDLSDVFNTLEYQLKNIILSGASPYEQLKAMGVVLNNARQVTENRNTELYRSGEKILDAFAERRISDTTGQQSLNPVTDSIC